MTDNNPDKIKQAQQKNVTQRTEKTGQNLADAIKERLQKKQDGSTPT